MINRLSFVGTLQLIQPSSQEEVEVLGDLKFGLNTALLILLYVCSFGLGMHFFNILKLFSFFINKREKMVHLKCNVLICLI